MEKLGRGPSFLDLYAPIFALSTLQAVPSNLNYSLSPKILKRVEKKAEEYPRKPTRVFLDERVHLSRRRRSLILISITSLGNNTQIVSNDGTSFTIAS